MAFNGGFRSTDPSHPGYHSEGRVAARLNSGQASLALRTDGTADVGTWNQEVRMTPAVANVRRNLPRLVDHPNWVTGTSYHRRRGGAPQGSTLFPTNASHPSIT